MLPLAGTILLNALPTLISKLPEIANIFKNPDVASRNVEAISKVGEILVQSTGASNVQDAVERISADPQTASEANDALRLSRADILDLIERVAKIDEASVAAARDFGRQDPPVWGNWHFIHILTMVLVILGGAAAVFVLVRSNDPTERAMSLQTLLLIGFGGGVTFWLGSSRSSQMKDIIKGGK